jgi:hypothetical protein
MLDASGRRRGPAVFRTPDDQPEEKVIDFFADAFWIRRLPTENRELQLTCRKRRRTNFVKNYMNKILISSFAFK